ncbi:MAG: hypothetical protein WD042_11795 [Phycisphaeraceae bacterium]
MCLGLVLGIFASATGAQTVPPAVAADQPVELRRLIRRFDFEERKGGNFEDMPRHWFAIGREARTSDASFLKKNLHDVLTHRDGFPNYASIGFDTRQPHGGEYSLHLGLNGGDTGVFIEVGAVRAVPGSDYQITTLLRTTRLTHARARLVAYLIDADGHRIDASLAASKPVQTDDQWQTVSVHLMGDYDKAAWIGMQLEVNQPELAPADALGKHRVLYKDIRGSAWFDDVAVWQVPRVSLGSQSKFNVVRAPERPELRWNVRDVSGHELFADLAVFDDRDQLVARTQRRVDSTKPINDAWQPELPRYGWFTVKLTLHDVFTGDRIRQASTMVVGQALVKLLWLPRELDVSHAQRAPFAIDATGMDAAHLRLLPVLLQAANLDAAILSCWEPATGRNDMGQRQELLEELIEPLLSRGGKVTLSLAPLPGELVKAQDDPGHGPMPLLVSAPQLWRPYLVPLLMRTGQQVRDWQLGSTDIEGAFALSDLKGLLDTIRVDFRGLAPDPNLVVPWRVDQARRLPGQDQPTFAIQVPPNVPPRHIAAHTTEWSDPPPARYVLHLRTLDPRVYSTSNRAIDLALRMVHGWESGAAGLALPGPWTTGDSRRPEVQPEAALGVFSAVTQRLAGRRAVGRLPLGDGLQCIIFDKIDRSRSRPGEPTGLLVAWAESATPARARIDMLLGGKPVAVDIWGNRRSVPLVDGRHQVDLAASPIFIEGIDADLARFRAGFAFAPAFIESVQTPHVCKLTITNPWSRTISGTVTIGDPTHWQIGPRRSSFTVASGQSLDIPLNVHLPVSEVAGLKKIVARFEFTADQPYDIDLEAYVEMGLRNVRCDASLAVERDPATGKDDAVVTQVITNRSDKDVSLYAFAALVGYPRQERLIPRLSPGESVVRRFRFPGGAAAVAQHEVRAGLRESAGPAILNKVLTLDAAP